MTPHEVTDAKYLEARLAGMYPKEAAEHAGFSPEYAAKASSRIEPRLAGTLREAMEKVGLTPELLALKMREGLEATKTLHASKDGVITDTKELTDYGERRQHIELAAKLRGDLAEQPINVNVVQVLNQIPQDLAAELVVTPIDVPASELVSTPTPTLQVTDNTRA